MNRFRRPMLVIVVALAAFSRSVATEHASWTLDVSLSTSSSAGVMGEYVYSEDRVVSYLDWQLVPLITLGAGIEGSAPWGTRLGARAALPLGRASGVVTNSDYEDRNEPAHRTRVSYHTANIDTYRDLDSWLTQPLVSGRAGFVAIGIGYRDRFVRMTAQDGTYDYGATAGEVTGVPITYEQHHRFAYAVLLAESVGKLRLTASVSFAPYVFVDALDHHHRRLLDFHDTIREARWLSAEIGASFELAGQTIEIAGFGELMPETRGDTYTVDYTGDSFVGTTSATSTDGAGVSWWQAGLRVSLPYGW